MGIVFGWIGEIFGGGHVVIPHEIKNKETSKEEEEKRKKDGEIRQENKTARAVGETNQTFSTAQNKTRKITERVRKKTREMHNPERRSLPELAPIEDTAGIANSVAAGIETYNSAHAIEARALGEPFSSAHVPSIFVIGSILLVLVAITGIFKRSPNKKARRFMATLPNTTTEKDDLLITVPSEPFCDKV